MKGDNDAADQRTLKWINSGRICPSTVWPRFQLFNVRGWRHHPDMICEGDFRSDVT